MDNRDIIIKYVFDDDYDPKYVNGVYGGVNPTGELVMSFFYERLPVPYEERQVLADDGRINGLPEITKPESSDNLKIRRTIKQGIILNKDAAVNIYKWLGERLQEMGVEKSEL